MKMLNNVKPSNRALRLLGQVALMAVIALGMTLPIVLTEGEAAAQSRVKKSKKRVVKKARKKKKKKKVTKTTRSNKRLVKRTRRPVRTQTRTRTRTRTIHHHRPARRHTTVHHYSNGRQSNAPRTVTRNDSPRSAPYLNLGIGAVGSNSSASAEEASTGLSVGLGLRASKNLALEMSILGVVDNTGVDATTGEGSQNLEFGGVSADARLILPLGAIEPYGLAGVGLYTLEQETAESLDPTVNLGFGADFKVTENIGLGGRYVYHGFWLGDSAGLQNQQPESAWSGMGMLSVSF